MKQIAKDPNSLSAQAMKALRRSARRARTVARMYGTPVYVWQGGKIAAEKVIREPENEGG